MTAESVPLTPRAQEFVASVVESGDLHDAAEVVDFALRHLKHERAAKFANFRREAQIGWDDLDAGRFTDVSDDDLDGFVANLSSRRH